MWSARIKYEGKQLHLGTYQTEEMAATVYNRTAREYFGEFAQLNILEEVEPVPAERRHEICKCGHAKSLRSNGVQYCQPCTKIRDSKRVRVYNYDPIKYQERKKRKLLQHAEKAT